MKTLREEAQTGTEIQIWIEARLCNSTDGGVEGTLLVVGYQRARALAPALGYQIRTSPSRSGSVAMSLAASDIRGQLGARPRYGGPFGLVSIQQAEQS